MIFPFLVACLKLPVLFKKFRHALLAVLSANTQHIYRLSSQLVLESWPVQPGRTIILVFLLFKLTLHFLGMPFSLRNFSWGLTTVPENLIRDKATGSQCHDEDGN